MHGFIFPTGTKKARILTARRCGRLSSRTSSTAEIHPSLAEIDFLVFSGDLAFSGLASEYETAGREFLDHPCYSYLRSFSVREIPVALMGMNSAWMCAQHEELSPSTGRIEIRDQGYLLLGEPQFSKLARTEEFKTAEVRIGVLHHPTDWFNKDLSRWSVESSLERSFNFLLRGHEHRSLAAGKIGPDGSCMLISAGATYDRRDYPNGYNFVHLDLDAGKVTIFFRRHVGGRVFQKDTFATGDKTPGFLVFDLLGNRASVEEKSAPEASSHLSSALSIHLVRDVHSEDVLAALELYADRIPRDEQFQAPDIMRWLRDDQDAIAAGKDPRQFFFVAKRDQVCGFALLHYLAQ